MRLTRICVVGAVSLCVLVEVAGSAPPPRGSLVQLSGTSGCITQGGQGGCGHGRAFGPIFTIRLSKDGRNAYVGSYSTLVFRRNRATGALTQLPGGSGCLENQGQRARPGCTLITGVLYAGEAVNLSPDEKTVYSSAVLDKGAYFAPTVVGYHRDPGTGALTQFAKPPECIQSSVSGKCLAAQNLSGSGPRISRDGKNGYLRLFGAIWTFQRDLVTGEMTALPDPVGCVKDPRFLPKLKLGCVAVRGIRGIHTFAESFDGRNAYVTSEEAVAIFRRDPANGSLQQLAGKAGCIASTGLGGACASGRGLYKPGQIVISGDGRNAYVVSTRFITAPSPKSHTLSVFRRNPRTGALTQLRGRAGCVSNTGKFGCAKGTALFGSHSVAVSPDGNYVYVVSTFDQAIAVFRRDKRTGAVQQLPGTAACANHHGYTFARGVCATARIGVAVDVVGSLDNRNVYVATSTGWPTSNAGGAIAVFRRTR